jgi:hypothetical protein
MTVPIEFEVVRAAIYHELYYQIETKLSVMVAC